MYIVYIGMARVYEALNEPNKAAVEYKKARNPHHVRSHSLLRTWSFMSMSYFVFMYTSRINS